MLEVGAWVRILHEDAGRFGGGRQKRRNVSNYRILCANRRGSLVRHHQLIEKWSSIFGKFCKYRPGTMLNPCRFIRDGHIRSSLNIGHARTRNAAKACEAAAMTGPPPAQCLCKGANCILHICTAHTVPTPCVASRPETSSEEL